MLLATRQIPQFKFNQAAQRFVAPNGRFVARETVKAASDMMNAQAARDMEAVSVRLQNGEITHAQWDSEMRLHIRRTVTGNAMLASGGRESMNQSKWGRAGALTREQNEYLNGMGERIQSGYYGEDLSKNGFVNHAKMYAKSGTGVFEYVKGRNAIEELGHTEIANELNENVEAHCKGEGSCKEITSFGWMSVDDERWTYPGQRLCLGNCQCRVKTRKGRA